MDMNIMEIPVTTVDLGKEILAVMMHLTVDGPPVVVFMVELLTIWGTGGGSVHTVISEMTFVVELTMVGP